MSVTKTTATEPQGPGIRDHVLVLPSVLCSRIVATRIADRVDGAVSTPHDHGCGQIGDDAAQTKRTFVGLARNPNVAGAVIVGLGCEAVQSDAVAAELEETVPTRELSIQGTGGTEACVERGVAYANELRADTAEPIQGSFDELTVGVIASDAVDSTVTAVDPAIGRVIEDLVDAGGRAIVAGTDRLCPHADAIAELTVDDACESAVRTVLESVDPHPVGRIRRRSEGFAPEQLTAQWGGRPLQTVVPYGSVAEHDRGVALLDAPATFAEAATGLAAAGANLIVHATADGEPAGHPVVPVLKVTGDPETAAALPNDIDIDASGATVDTIADSIRERISAVAAGEPTCAETHGLTAVAISRTGPSM